MEHGICLPLILMSVNLIQVDTLILSTQHKNATKGHDFTLTCKHNLQMFDFVRDRSTQECLVYSTECKCDANPLYRLTCGNNIYNLTIPGSIIAKYHRTVWQCTNFADKKSNEITVKVNVPITTITLNPVGDSGQVSVVIAENRQFTCKTDSGRPSAWINWFIGGRDVTDQATSQTHMNDTEYITQSILTYRGNDSDHTKKIYCEAGNIKEFGNLTSEEKSLFIIFPVTSITIFPASDNHVVNVVLNRTLPFTCRTNAARPVALIKWYIGEKNVANQANTSTTEDESYHSKFITTSTLDYIGKEEDHNKTIYCQAWNLDENQAATTDERTIYIRVPVTSLTVEPVDNKGMLITVSGETRTFNCKTNPIRPGVRIQWYIDGKNVTDLAIISSEQDKTDSSKFVYTSVLSYNGQNADHEKVVYCEAIDEESNKFKSAEGRLFVRLPIETITIDQVGINDKVRVVSGSNKTFTCRTGSGRPAALINWFIGGKNVSNQAHTVIIQDSIDKTTSKSISTFVYIGKTADHNKTIYCEAFNIEDRQNIVSNIKTLFIIIPVPKVSFVQVGESNDVKVAINRTKELICKTEVSRPASWISWFIEGKNITSQSTLSISPNDSDKFTSTSKLVYTGIDADHNFVIYCEAVNTIGGRTVKSDNKTLFIMISITKVTITTDMTINVVNIESKKTHIFTCITSSGRPAAWIKWYIGGEDITQHATIEKIEVDDKYISNSSFLYTGNDSDHSNVIYCEAGNIFEGQKFLSDKKKLYITVPTTKVLMMQPVIGDTVTVISGESTNLTCKTDASRPVAWIQWYINRMNVTDQAIPITKENGTKYISYSTLIYFGKIRDHKHVISCEAMNTLSSHRNVSDTTSLNVLSSPTTEGDHSFEEKIFVGTNEGLNLTVVVIANPSPTANLIFTNGTEHEYNISRTYINITSVDTFRHIIRYEKENPIQTDFGNYTVRAFNDIGTMLVHTFIVEPSQSPFKPLNVHAECHKLIPRINVSWKSNFDGGKPQMFKVFFISEFTVNDLQSTNISDKGQHENHYHIQSLDYGTKYRIYVGAINEYGGVNSSNLVNCTTAKKLPEGQGSLSAIIGSVAGGSSAVVVILVVVIAFLVRRCTKQKGIDKQQLNRCRENEASDDEMHEDGLKDNPLYVTTEISVKKDVHSKDHAFSKNTKTTGKKFDKAGQIYQKSKGQLTQGMELDVYENSEDLRKAIDTNIYGNIDNDSGCHVTPISSRTNTKNKDGLIYADLEFASQSGKRLFIIGSENRTNYAIIDLTKKADPIPDYSDEDVKKETD